MKKCKVLVHNSITDQNEWISGEIVGYRSRLDIDQKGIDVITDDGRGFKGCHPDCVQVIEETI